ncbi:hypothetical protein QBC37DRAFT_430435 [Rhypophila decipiens]|uniref:Uncharacterized protein n=1 Tax=Rhypophila decipiens TaxID=261697 RepID=A0AAN6Y197_9PEZI|nr:hypothetical protein QBC37DRAFT_430435 [Rhypophila decipiens]
MPYRFTATTTDVNVPPTTRPDWTNLGPLTSIFTPPPRCSNNGNLDDWGRPFADGRPFAYIPERWPSLVFVNSNNVECYPPTATTGPTTTFRPTGTITSTSTGTFVDFQHKYFSPGICPSGWYSAADYGTQYAGSPRLDRVGGGKIAVCCPTGYTAAFESLTTPDPRVSTGSCLSVLTSPVAAVTCATCNDDNTSRPIDNDNGVAIVQPTVTPTDLGSVGGQPHAMSPGSVIQVTAVETTILVRWAPTDQAMLDRIRAGDEEHGLSSLTTGQQAGLWIGVALAALLVLGTIAGVVILGKRKRAKKQAVPVTTGPRMVVDSESPPAYSPPAYKLESDDGHVKR